MDESGEWRDERLYALNSKLQTLSPNPVHREYRWHYKAHRAMRTPALSVLATRLRRTL